MNAPVYVPPHSRDAEIALLGALMSLPAAQDVAAEVSSSDFFDASNAAIFRSVVEVISSGRTPDIVCVFEHMREAGREVDLTHLNDIQLAGSGSVASARRHAEIIKERATRRKLLAYSASLHDSGQSALTTPELIERATADLFEIVDKRVSRTPRPAGDVVGAQLVEIQNRVDARRAGKRIGTTTGLVDLNKLLGGGYRPGDLVVVAGRPAMGKTAFALTQALRQAEDGLGVLFCSQEMRTEELIDRCVSAMGGVPLQNIRTGEVSEDNWSSIAKCANDLSMLPLHIDDQPAMTLMDVRAKARAVKSRNRLDVIFVDYLQLMTGDGENRTQEIGRLSRGLKALAKELSVTVVAMSQLNRGVENRADRRPLMSDLRESGDIEADADTIIMLYRDEVYNPEAGEKGVADLIVVKQRAGPIGTVHAAFRGEYTRFDNLAMGRVAPPPVPSRATSYMAKAVCPD